MSYHIGAFGVAGSSFKELLHTLLGKTTLQRSATVGIAVSGGVDSMALAYLCSRLKDQGSRCAFHAFIVDHGARQGSAQEARDVASNLRSLGLPTTILDVSWPANVEPLTLSYFESSARTRRFQALGRACEERQIRHLLLAHHEDDQAETVMMRIAQGYTGAGLRGTRTTANIPECFGIAGVNQTVDSGLPSSSNPINRRNIMRANAGVLVHRPLLGFTKSQLTETCQAHGIAWKEDITNSDPKLTTRNAVRHLFNNHNLPQALQKDSLLTLAGRVERKRTASRQEAIRMIGRLGGVLLDSRSGICRFDLDIANRSANMTEGLKLECLKYLSSLVSPHQTISDESFDEAAGRVFSTRSGTHPDCSSPSSFTAGGVLWSRVDFKANRMLKNTHWSLSRQPLGLEESKRSCRWTGGQSHDEWQLFDGRFWLRVGDSRVGPITARAFQPSDMTKLRDMMPSQKMKRLEQKLKSIAPGKTRWTLPIFITSRQFRPLCLPSLGFVIDKSDSFADWDVRYKNIEVYEDCPVLIHNEIG